MSFPVNKAIPTAEQRTSIEFAYKGTGLDYQWNAYQGFVKYHGGGQWNPLEDNGDAMDLAVMLNLRYEVTNDGSRVYLGDISATESGPDVFGAFRRCIVSVAEQLGKARSN